MAKTEIDISTRKPLTDDEKAKLAERFNAPKDEWERLFFGRAQQHPGGAVLPEQAYERATAYED
ncbi:MAG TPA: hypothetical protein VGK19_05585 [Capsulimonadaceae bacterium]|jgi:hypothetical protein